MTTKLESGNRPICAPEEYLICPRRVQMCEVRKADSPCPVSLPVNETPVMNMDTPDNESIGLENRPVKVTFVMKDAALYEAVKKICDDEGRFIGAVISNLLQLYVQGDVGRLDRIGWYK